MIPFNHLGLLFKLFSPWLYPVGVRDSISELLKDVKPGSYVIDIGSGTGVLTQFAYKMRGDLKYVVLDPAQGMIKYAPPYTFKIRARAESLPLKNIFTVALMGEAIHHVDDPRKAIMNIKDCLTSKGLLFIYDFNPDTFIGRMIYRIERLFKEPANFYSPEGLSDMLSQHDFHTTIIRYGWRYSITAVKGPDLTV